MNKTILFDLDGTLTESGEGITKCVQYALSKMGIHEPDLSKLREFIGPPLVEQFIKYANFSHDEAQQALQFYRERYSVKGIYENKLYPGTVHMLKYLASQQYTLAVASSKPEHYVSLILDYFKIKDYFTEICGATMDEKRVKKQDVIETALTRLGMCYYRDKAIMVGDKSQDVFGAKSCGIQCIAVSYGYGTREELINANAEYIVNSVSELTKLICDL